jgi:hypothetical protein
VGQPTWVVPVYAIVYGLGTLAALEVLQRRPGPYRIHHIWIAASIAIATIEFVAISCGVYNYEGHQELLVAGRYPAWCALLEGGCVAVWAALVAGARPSLTGARSILVAPLFAAVFAAIMYGAGTPALVADNLGANDLVGTTACLLVVLLCLGIVSSAGELFEKATTVRSTVLSSVTEAAKEHSAEWAATAHHVSRSEEIGSSR